MKLALIGPVYPYRGGIAHYTTLLAKYLARRHRVWVISFHRQYPKLIFPGRTDHDPSKKVIKVNAHYILDPLNPITWWRTARFIRDKTPDGVIMQWWVPFWAPAWWVIMKLMKGLRIVCLCHNILPHEGKRSVKLIRWVAKTVLMQADVFIVHAKTELKTLKELLPDKPIKYVTFPSYSELATSIDGRISREEAKNALGLAGVPILLFFGFVRPYKGLEILLKAMPKIVETTGAKLVIAGEFWEKRSKYERLIEVLGIGDWVKVVDGYIPNEELPTYFKAADVAVFPYLSATQSGSVSLAMGFGVPVVATKVGGIAELVGENGWLVEPGDVEALSAACIEALRTGDCRTGKREPGEKGWVYLVDEIERLLTHQAGEGDG